MVWSNRLLQSTVRPRSSTPGDPFPVFYAMGWTVNRRPGRTSIAHAGSWHGFSNYYVRIPETRTSVAVFANLDTADVATIAKKILERL